MLIKTTYDNVDTHGFIALPDADDTLRDHDVSVIYYKVWAMNTGLQLLNELRMK